MFEQSPPVEKGVNHRGEWNRGSHRRSSPGRGPGCGWDLRCRLEAGVAGAGSAKQAAVEGEVWGCCRGCYPSCGAQQASVRTWAFTQSVEGGHGPAFAEEQTECHVRRMTLPAVLNTGGGQGGGGANTAAAKPVKKQPR